MWNETNSQPDIDTTFYTMDTKSLEPGDILVCENHIEFYIGYNYKNYYKRAYNKDGSLIKQDNENEKKKNGINEINRKERIVTKSKIEGSFGWGGVNDEYPAESSSNHKHYFYYNNDDGYFQHCMCGNEPETMAYKCKILSNGKEAGLTLEQITELNKGYVEGDVTEENIARKKVDVLETFQRPIHEFNGCEFANEHYKYSVIWRKGNE